jgi:hypothetical protein
MTDTWERRNVAVTPGYNNPDFGTLTFTPVYSSGPDELVITASHPVFAAAQTIGYQTTLNSGTIVLPNFTVDSPTQITIPNASSYDTMPFDFTQLDFFNAGPTLIGTWTGTVNVAVVPFIQSYSYGIWWNKNDPGGNWSFAAVPTAEPEPGFFFYTSATFATDGGDGVRITGVRASDGFPLVLDYVYTIDPTPFKYGGIPQDGYFILSDPILGDLIVSTVEALDNTGTPLESPYALATNFIPTSFASQVQGDEATFHVDFVGAGSPNMPTRLTLYTTTPDALHVYYDPLGPNAGLNPGGATIVTWTNTVLEINDPAIAAEDVVRVEILDGTSRIYGDMQNPIVPQP